MEMQTSTFERQKGMALYKQIYLKLRKDIMQGYLKKGDRLPSIRSCEQLFKVSKTSVERAYQLLLDEGYISSRPQAGYYVDVDEEHVRMRLSLLQNVQRNPAYRIRYDFRSQSMDHDAFDMTLWKKYLKEVLELHQVITTYGDAQGEVSLREALQKYAYSMRGVLCDVDAILIGASFQSLLFLLCGLLDKQMIVGMEKSGFSQAEEVFKSYGFPIVYLSLEEDGISIAELRKHHVQVLYINAGSLGKNHQPLSKKKKEELLRWAKQANAFIIEDDHNGELRYATKVTSAMQGFDMGERIFYIGSFSRLLLPSLRISYLVMTQDIKQRYISRKDNYAPTSSKIEQLALARYITDGHLERHIRRLKKRYEKKSQHMLDLLHTYLPEASCILEEASLQYVLRFPYELNYAEILVEGEKKGIAFNINSCQELVISFAAIAEKDMDEGIYRLRQLLHENAI